MIKILSNISIFHYLLVALFLFLTGLFGVVISKNLIKVLISVEFMLSAVSINFVAFANFFDVKNISGMTFNLFIIVIGAVQLAVLISLIFAVFNYKKSINANRYKELKG